MKNYLFIFISFLLIVNSAFCQEHYPEIKKLSIEDPLFKKYCDDVAEARKFIARGLLGKDFCPSIYRYTAKDGDTIIKIAARCSIPYDAIATINRINTASVPVNGIQLLLPAMPAIYVPEQAESSIEKLIAAAFEKIETEPLTFDVTERGKNCKFYCFPNMVFDGTVRAFFLRSVYRFPLKEGILTSGFGKRKSPFTGKDSYHPGIDLAAPTGSPVYACTSGSIKEINYNKIYGNYIILAHTDGRESLYGHLSAVHVKLHEKIKSGTVIGSVGSTGMSTGPHLHFEIRIKGVPKNPSGFIEKKEK